MNYPNRIQNVQKILIESSIDAILIDEPVNLLYLTGLEMSAGKLIVHKDGALLLVDGRYFEMCSKVPFLTVVLWKENRFENLFKEELKHIKKLGFSSENTPYATYSKMIEKLDLSLIPLSHPLQTLRSVKDAEEITALKEAAALGSRGYDFIVENLKEGVTELDLVTELDIFWKRAGGKQVAFDPIIAFGTNTSMPHYHPKRIPLERGQPVLIDIGVTFNHYQSDMTRVVFFGEPDPKLKEIYKIVLQAQKRALKKCTPNSTTGVVDAAARKWIEERGYGENFPHGLGHGVGLDIHEQPVLSPRAPHSEIRLQPGMVITVEPGIYLPNLGGVRIEDTIVITETGYEVLTQRSKDLHIL